MKRKWKRWAFCDIRFSQLLNLKALDALPEVRRSLWKHSAICAAIVAGSGAGAGLLDAFDARSSLAADSRRSPKCAYSGAPITRKPTALRGQADSIGPAPVVRDARSS